MKKQYLGTSNPFIFAGAIKRFIGVNPHMEIVGKEINFFSNSTRYNLGLSYYKSVMPKSSADQVTMEGSPAYLPVGHTPGRVYALDPCMKVLVTLVNPVQRLISHHAHMIAMNISEGYRDGKQVTDFHEYYFFENGTIRLQAAGIVVGFYYTHIQKWFEFYPRDRIHFVDGVRLKKEPWVELQAIEEFMGVPVTTRASDFICDEKKGFYCHRKRGCLNKMKGLKHTNVSDSDLFHLNQMYRASCVKLFTVLDLKMSWACWKLCHVKYAFL